MGNQTNLSLQSVQFYLYPPGNDVLLASIREIIFYKNLMVPRYYLREDWLKKWGKKMFLSIKTK